MSIKKLDYLILGGGLSGLYCARRLLKEKGIGNLMILEAKNRIGGRVMTYKGLQNNNYADLGAQWVLPEHTRVQELCKNYSIKLFPTYSEGDSIYQLKGKLYKDSDASSYSEFTHAFFNSTEEFVENFLSFLKQKKFQDPTIPKITLEEYLEDYISKNEKIKGKTKLDLLRQHIRANLESVTAFPLSKISLQYAVFMESQGKDFTSLEGEFEQMRVEGGTENIIQKLSEEIEAHQYLEYNSKAVEVIQHSADNIEVKVLNSIKKNGIFSSNEPLIEKSYFTKNLIITIPPFILKQMKLRLLNAQSGQKLRNILNNYDVGNVIKTFVIYDTPFWRKQNLNGSVFCAENPYISDIYDMSCNNSQNGILQLFSVGTKATEAQKLTKQQFQTKTIETLVQFFGKEAFNYFDFYSHSFINDPFVLGGYSGIQQSSLIQNDETPISEFSRFNSSDNQNLFFIGTETSQSYNGYLEGAIRSVDQLFENGLSNQIQH